MSFILKYFSLALLFVGGVQAQIDPQASLETKSTYQKLKTISKSFRSNQRILLGQQNAFTEGRGWRLSNNHLGTPLKSDMHDVARVHPAVFGLDFNEIGNWNEDLIIEKIREVHARGGIFTLSWHMPTLIDDGRGSYSYNDTTSPVVKHILPGGFAHEKFKNELLKFVEFTEKISDIPIIFRPFHEHNRSWFWWGKNHCTVQEYKSLWRFTVDFLRSHNAHNILYAYSPNYVTWDYLERYPGDQYVDILGVDMYFRNPLFDLWEHGATPQLEWKHDIVWLMREAEKRDKIPAITEFGQEGSWYERFWTDYMGWPIERAGVAQITGHHALPRYGIAYIMLWRNDIRDPKHFYGPVPGHMNNYNFHQLRSKKIFKGLGE